jgi:hypothetical protein
MPFLDVRLSPPNQPSTSGAASKFLAESSILIPQTGLEAAAYARDLYGNYRCAATQPVGLIGGK